ncbi:MAG: cysteine desulfurase [SAR324 cluster bacterium]|nr:cysteine desulfurase [SAR324 cluster bacterium]
MFSSDKVVYFDYNATAVPLPQTHRLNMDIVDRCFGNPSSPHQCGREAKDLLESSRLRIAQLLGVSPQEILFTSGGTEGNNTILRQLALQISPQHVITSQIEHPSILETCRVLEQLPQIEVTYLPVTENGVIDPEILLEAIRPDTCLISLMTVNNETGVIQPMEQLSSIAQAHEIPLHTDSVQGVGKIPISWAEWGVHYATATAHKWGGPKGIGLLYVKQGASLEGLITGGKQERGRRAGTENVMLIHDFAESLQWTINQQAAVSTRLQSFKKQIINQLETTNGFFINGQVDSCLPSTLNVGFEGVSAESLLISLDLDNIAVSTGAACSSGAIEASHVLLAMGLDRKKAKSCLRISMGWNTIQEEVNYLMERIQFHVNRLYQKNNARP